VAVTGIACLYSAHVISARNLPCSASSLSTRHIDTCDVQYTPSPHVLYRATLSYSAEQCTVSVCPSQDGVARCSVDTDARITAQIDLGKY